MKAFDYGTMSFPDTFTVVESKTLQMTDMMNGNNKFFQAELHQSNSQFRIFTCYGRTGAAYAKKEERFPEHFNAKSDFEKLVSSKLKKGYREVKVAATAKGSDVCNNLILSGDVRLDNVKQDATVTTLSPWLQTLVTRLYAEAGNSCRGQLHGSLQTSADNPLGTLTQSQIAAGKSILQNVHHHLNNYPHDVGKVSDTIVRLTNEFYSFIPQAIPLRPRDEHSRSVWLKEYCLNRPTILDEKNDLLELLGNVQGMISGFASDDVGRKYAEMNCVVKETSRTAHSWLGENLVNSQSSHHSWKLQLTRSYEVSAKAQERHQITMSPIGNVKELYHGSRSANILGICKQGLLLRPAGVYVTGSMFGNGLYFASQSTKSSQYSTARFGGQANGHGDTFFMFVAEVALGRIKEFSATQGHLQAAPYGYDSVMGKKGVSLLHDEYIIYNIKQHKLKYLLEFSQSYRR